MTPLAREWTAADTSFDYVIVGSGYGGAISAARLASASLGKSVCVLERGREWPVGKFPDTLAGFGEQVRLNNPLGQGTLGNPRGLFDLVNFEDLSVMKGNGLGGTSLINANVAIVPDAEAFEQSGWPASLNVQSLGPYYDRAAEILRPNVHPDASQLPKWAALRRRADEIGGLVQPLNIVVNFQDQADNGFGMAQRACTDCGDCVTGCNVGAKNTLYMNYLPMAKRAGATILTGMEVEWMEKTGGGWRVHGKNWTTAGPVPFTINAGTVILSAGALNTTEILLRSRENGLSLSDRIGHGFSGNGDFFGISYNGRDYLQVLGFGNHPDSPGAATPPGPTITGVLRYTGGRPLADRFLIEDVSFPGALFAGAQAAFPLLGGEEFGPITFGRLARVARDMFPGDPYERAGALNHSMLYLVTAFDDAGGVLKLDNGRLALDWDGSGRQRIFDMVNEELRRHGKANRAKFIANPVWDAFGLHRLITVHPLGGCPVGEDHTRGAADEFGRVFAGNGELHAGLLVSDGSIIPSALGVNPFLTISAMAERTIEGVINEARGAPERVTTMSMAGASMRAEPAPQLAGLVLNEYLDGTVGELICTARLRTVVSDFGSFLNGSLRSVAVEGTVDLGGTEHARRYTIDSAASYVQHPKSPADETEYYLVFSGGDERYVLLGRRRMTDSVLRFTLSRDGQPEASGTLQCRIFSNVVRGS